MDGKASISINPGRRSAEAEEAARKARIAQRFRTRRATRHKPAKAVQPHATDELTIDSRSPDMVALSELRQMLEELLANVHPNADAIGMPPELLLLRSQMLARSLACLNDAIEARRLLQSLCASSPESLN